MNSTQGVVFTGLTSASGSFALRGGRYLLTLVLSGGSSPTVYLEVLGADGSTWVQMPVIATYNATDLTATGALVYDCSPGTYRVNVTGSPTSADVAVSSVPFA